MHVLKSATKIYSFFIYLCLIPYANSSYIALSLFFYINTIFYGKIKNKKKYLIRLTSALLVLICSGIIFTYETGYLERILSIKLSKAYLCIKSFPIFSHRLILISLHYLVIINLMFASTIFTEIILCFLVIIAKNSSNIIQKTIFISSFACQYLDRISIKIMRMMLAKQLKRISLISSVRNYMLMHSVLTLIQDIRDDAYTISALLHIKNLNNDMFHVVNLNRAISTIT